MSLTSLIVQREIATIRQVEEALARQVLYGGDLVTNLLDVCPVDESALNRLVAESFGLQAAPSGELPAPSEDAKKVLAPIVAAERGLAPLSVDRYGFVVAVAEPLAPDVEQELSFSLAMPIAQQIAPLVRVRQALSRDYGLPLDRRTTRVLARMRGELPFGSGSMPPPPASSAAELAALNDPRAAHAAPAAPAPAAPAPAAAAAAPAPGALTFVRDVEVPAAPPPRRRRGPLVASVARDELERVEDRDAILDLVFEFARQFFDYAVLFVVKDDLAEGRYAFGSGAPREKVARIGVPLAQESILRMARETGALFRTKVKATGVDAVLLGDLGRLNRGERAVVPVVVRERVVALVLGDADEGSLDEENLAEVRGVVAAGAAAFERLIVRRKLKGAGPSSSAIVAAPPSSAAPLPSAALLPSAASLPPPTMASAADELAPAVREIVAELARADAVTVEPPGVTAEPPPVAASPGAVASRPPAVASRPPAVASRPPAVAASPPTASRKPPASVHRAEAPALEFASSPPPSYVERSFAERGAERRAGGAPSGEPVDQGTLDGRDAVPSTTRDASSPATAQPASSPPASPSAHSPVPPRPHPVTAVSPGALPMFPEQTPYAPPVFDDMDATPAAPEVAPVFERVKPMPASEQQVSVAAHRPPSSRSDETRVLPSIIVDVASEFVALVDRVLAGPDDEAERGLLRGGGYAMPAIMARFPGPVAAPLARADGALPRVGDCGPILRLVSGQRRVALPFVLALVEDVDAVKRFWATYLLTELVYPDAIQPALERLFDEEPRIRRVAHAAIRALAEAMPGALIERLDAIASDRSLYPARRVGAIEALAETREPAAAPVLIRLLQDAPSEVPRAAHRALVALTRQDFGSDSLRWGAWWSSHGGSHRIEWLVDALGHEEAPIRAAAAQELAGLTKEDYGLRDDLSRRDRERVQARYREWWASVGRVRFSRR